MPLANVIVMVLVGLAGLTGLFMAAYAVDQGIYIFGLGLTAFAVFFQFWMIKHHFNALSQRASMTVDKV